MLEGGELVIDQSRRIRSEGIRASRLTQTLLVSCPASLIKLTASPCILAYGCFIIHPSRPRGARCDLNEEITALPQYLHTLKACPTCYLQNPC